MAELKAGQVERFIAKPDLTRPTILIYGPDEGLVSERADLLCSRVEVDLSDAFSYIKLNADDVAADGMRLADEAHTVAMFGGKRLIRISGSTRRDLVKAVTPVLNQPPLDCMIVIEAGELRKTSGLRKLIEKAPNAIALPCYQDNLAALDMLISEELEQNGISITQEDRSLLRSMLGADRRASRNELKKLALYAHEKKQIDTNDIKLLVGDVSVFAINDIIDGAATGNMSMLETGLARAEEAGTSADLIVMNTARHFETLHWAKSQMVKSRQNAKSIFRQIRPPIHFTRERLICDALTIWPEPSLRRSMHRLRKAGLECRKNHQFSEVLASTTLLAISIEAKALKRKGGF